MKVNGTQAPVQPLLEPAATHENPQASFQATLETAQQNLAQTSGSTLAKSTENKGTRVPVSQMSPAEYLADYLRKTPEQHMRDAILREMGLTEEDLAAMPPEQRAAVEQTIAEKTKELLLRQTGNPQNRGQPPASLAFGPMGAAESCVNGISVGGLACAPQTRM